MRFLRGSVSKCGINMGDIDTKKKMNRYSKPARYFGKRFQWKLKGPLAEKTGALFGYDPCVNNYFEKIFEHMIDNKSN